MRIVFAGAAGRGDLMLAATIFDRMVVMKFILPGYGFLGMLGSVPLRNTMLGM